MQKSKYISLFKDITNRIALESKCAFIKVAAIFVRDSHIVCTGVNGTAPGKENCIDHFKKIWKKDSDKSLLFFEDWLKTEHFRNIHKEWSIINDIHAEQNAIAYASKERISLKDCDVFCSYEPCQNCSKLLVSLKPKRIFYINEYDRSLKETKKYIESNEIDLIKI